MARVQDQHSGEFGKRENQILSHFFGTFSRRRDTLAGLATGYLGTVHFTSSDKAAKLPANYMFTATDGQAVKLPGGNYESVAGKQLILLADDCGGPT
jgi:hypothetical protein